MDENIKIHVRDVLEDKQFHKGLVVDSESGHLIVKDVFVSTCYSINPSSSILDYLVVLEVIDDSGDMSYMSLEKFKDKKVNNGKTCDECGSARVVSYDRTGVVVCEECGEEFPDDKFENKLNDMVQDITEAVETGEFLDRDIARWRITEWYVDEIGVETVHSEIGISDEEIHLDEYETETMTRANFEEASALEKLRKYDRLNS